MNSIPNNNSNEVDDDDDISASSSTSSSRTSEKLRRTRQHRQRLERAKQFHKEQKQSQTSTSSGSQQHSQQQRAIHFNNNGVRFLEHGLYQDALDMFLGSMQVTTNMLNGEQNYEDSLGHIRKASEKQCLTLPMNKFVESRLSISGFRACSSHGLEVAFGYLF